MKIHCSYCKSDKLSFITDEIRDSKDSVIRKCESCGLIFLDSKEMSVEKTNDLERYYNEEYGFENSLISGKKISVSEHFEIRMKTQRQIISSITPYLKNFFDILDIGCGCGSLLYLLKDYVNSYAGIEINREQAEFARVKLNCNIYSRIKEIPKGQKFDSIFLISVLEHIDKPFEVLEELKGLLKQDGFLYIEIPNCDEALLHYLPENSIKSYKKFFYHKAHLYYFTDKFFGRLLENCGYSYGVSSRHDYTLMNFLHWWFLGEKQPCMETAQCEMALYDNEDDSFKREMNDIMKSADAAFKEIMQKYKKGYILTYVAKLAKNLDRNDNNLL